MDISVDRIVARYRIPPRARGAPARMNALFRRTVPRYLNRALSGLALGGDEVFIRRLVVPARLDIGLGDSSLAETWSAAIAAEIRRAIERGGDDVVRYSSRRHALFEFIAGTATGRVSRAWAWWQLGWGRGARGGDAIVQALEGEPRLIAPLMAEVAAHGLFGALAAQLEPRHWQRLGQAVIVALDAPETPGAGASPDDARRIVARSRIVAAAVTTRVVRGAVSRWGVAVLACAEIEPAWLAAGIAPLDEIERLVGEAIARRNGTPAEEPAPSVRPRADAATPTPTPTPTPAPAAAATDRDAPRTIDTARPLDDVPEPRPEATPVAPIPDEALAPRSTRPAEAEPVTAPPAEPAPAPRAEPAPEAAAGDAAERTAAPDEAAPEETADPRRTGDTRFGGLLYLINLVADLRLPTRFISSPPLAARPLRWTLHALAQRLAPVAADDPAALAFAGLPPGARSPDLDEPEATEDEREAVAAAADAIEARLWERAPDLPLTQLCLRPARIVADPGWIEIHFPLDAVSTEVRRTGLDLDPNWVPWLGVVVRFIYG